MTTYFFNGLLPGVGALECIDSWGRTWPQLPPPEGKPSGRKVGCVWDQNKGEETRRLWLEPGLRRKLYEVGLELAPVLVLRLGGSCQGSRCVPPHLLRPVPPPCFRLAFLAVKALPLLQLWEHSQWVTPQDCCLPQSPRHLVHPEALVIHSIESCEWSRHRSPGRLRVTAQSWSWVVVLG